MTEDRDVITRGKKFDFDRVLADVPDAIDTTRGAEAAVAAGDLIFRARDRKGMSQVTLAKRVGTTQPHISDIERGIGENGPTAGTLSRLLRELDDELLLLSRNDQALWIAERIDAAEIAIGELAERIARLGVTDMNAVMEELAKANKVERENPFKNMLLDGLILGIHIALRAQPDALVGADRKAAARHIVEEMSETPASEIDAT